MKEMGTMVVSLVEDRDTLKWRVNLIKGDKINGFLRPAKLF